MVLGTKKEGDATDVLGEHWFPVGEVSVESLRERVSMTALPPTYYLHVWFARRPLAASRAAILGAITTVGYDHDSFFNMMGMPIDVDITKCYKEYQHAKAMKKQIKNPFTWKRSFTHNPDHDDLKGLNHEIK